ncbi:MAG: dienelactone hydrolase family protein [Saprospiraceae bacterium]|nr:dienelactone hydrolase family protein [Saprospiraceae bacterium]
MRTLIYSFLILALGCFYACENRSNPVMCHDPNEATVRFAAFGNEKEFRDAHPAPLPVSVTNEGDMVEFPVAGGPNGRAYLVKAHSATNKYLILFHEWWGLNDYIKNEADLWSHELGVHVIAVDLYDGKVATTAEEARGLMQACDAARASAVIEGAGKFAGDAADFRTMGWCFGGGWSLQGALLLKNRVKACVMYYGMPETDVEKLKTLSTEVVFIHPKQDKWITDEVVSNFETNMKSAGKTLSVHHYDADHAFANPSSPRYNEQAAKDAREVVRAYLIGTL